MNISSIVVTLDVSKLSGLLNAFAFCRVERGEHTVRNGVRARSQGCRGVAAAHAVCTREGSTRV